MNLEEEKFEAIEDPEYIKYRIQEQEKLKSEKEFRLKEINAQIEYTEKIELRNFKLESFKLALSAKPTSYSSHGINQSGYSVDSLIKDANKIYQELIKE